MDKRLPVGSAFKPKLTKTLFIVVGKNIEHEGINVSQEAELRPGEQQGWEATSRIGSEFYTASALKKPETIEALKGKSITLSIKDTSEITLEQIEELKKQGINIDRVYVNTGWTETQNRGYSLETFSAIKERMNGLTCDIDKNATEQEKYLQIREKITSSIKYDYAALNTTANDRDYYASRNLENGLLRGTCVCAGYSDIMKNALAELGIESKYVEGKTNKGELHAWLQVKIDGKWYNDDITWDAVNKASGKNGYQYCMMTDEEFNKTHTYMKERTEGYTINTCDEQPPAAVMKLRQPVRQIDEDEFDR